MNNPQISFDEEKLVITEELLPIFEFLIEIDKEIETLLNFQKKLDFMKVEYLKMTNFVIFLGEKLKENNIDFEYKLDIDTDIINKKLNPNLPPRSQMIVLFATLEVLYHLYTAYENEIYDEKEMRNKTMDDKKFKKFVNNFLLNDRNDYYKQNKVRFSKIDCIMIKDLRNSLTHFFSVSGGIQLVSKEDKNAIKLENILKQNKLGGIIFLCPNDLHQLIKYANAILFRKWTNDSATDTVNFHRKIKFVYELVHRDGSIIMPDINSKI